ncbi:hypothetical protein [Sphaerospermopsis sp. FACHB-1194]|uniref:hypothetical protein n=1 Tax=Sphaerospermopsis sp. FACHB-1194 TaxID=2692862 RepID=UPI0016806930|nr:hypothetical protein [Sphaerospermopsis sp. FACHB-1194]MBD2145232.1 hypothetical protein [Sphaerospermopsis sp. FACHB-1194]
MNRKDSKNIHEILLEAIQKSEVVDNLKDFAEIGIDELLDDGILKDIPVISPLYSIIKLNSTVRDITFIKKIVSFYLEIGYVDDKFKEKFMVKYKCDPQYRKKVGEYIINALDRFDQINKAEAFGKIFAAYIKNEIKYNELTQYSYALDKIDFFNIHILKNFYLSQMSPDQTSFLQNFVFAGLVSIDFGNHLMNHSWFSEFTPQTGFSKNEFGEKFLKILELI